MHTATDVVPLRQNRVGEQFGWGVFNSKNVRVTLQEARARAFRTTGLLGRDVAGRLGKALDPVLDFPKRLQAGFDRRRRNVVQQF